MSVCAGCVRGRSLVISTSFTTAVTEVAVSMVPMTCSRGDLPDSPGPTSVPVAAAVIAVTRNGPLTAPTSDQQTDRRTGDSTEQADAAALGDDEPDQERYSEGPIDAM